jgi:GWxTD domain-containing protein
MKKIFLLIAIFCFADVYSQIPGKRQSEYGFDVDYKPPVYYDFYLTYANENRSPRLVFTLSIQNDLFQFTKVADVYQANYHVALTIKKNGSETAVFSRVWQESVLEKDFDLTNSRKIYQNHEKKFDVNLDPGEYKVLLEVTDDGTQKGYQNQRPLIVPHTEPGGIEHTVVKFLDPDSDRSVEIIADPRDPMIDFNRDVSAYFEMQTAARDSLIITSKLLLLKDESGSVVRQRIYRYLPTGPVLAFRERIDKKDLPEGKYTLKYRLRYGERIVEFEKKFEVVWFEKPVYLYRYDLAIRPMKYILTPDEWNEADGLSYDDLEVWFKNYWKKKDPDPETPYNEIMYTFFKRVDESNRLYGQRFKEGWETDRGRSYLLYGKPDRQEINRTTINTKPYEIWFYDQLHKKLVFVDKHDDEDYELVQIEDIKDSGNE